MKLVELIRMAFHNLWTRKLRTVLNLVGIVIASVLLLSTLAATEGIKKAVLRFVENSEHSRQFRIYPDFDRSVEPPENEVEVKGEMSERRRSRIRKILEEQWREDNQPRRYKISPEVLQKIKDLPHVTELEPRYSATCDISVSGKTQTVFARSFSALNASLPERMVTGQLIDANDQNTILIHEGLAYQLGFRSDTDLENLIGNEIVLRFPVDNGSISLFGERFFRMSVQQRSQWFRILEHLLSGQALSELDQNERMMIQDFFSERKKSKESRFKIIERRFRVGGVFRRRDEEDIQNVLERFTGGMGDLLIHHQVFQKELAEVVKKRGIFDANVYVDQYANLEQTVEQAQQNSMQVISPTSVIERIIEGVNSSKFTLTVIVLIVLFISAIGISNTMFISLIERTEEIGIMKAVGGSNGDVLRLILVEGMITGLLGGLFSIGVAFLISAAGNELLRSYVESRSRMSLEGQLFQIAGWMALLTIGLATLTTTLAGLWPAWRASRLDPVDAMGQR